MKERFEQRLDYVAQRVMYHTVPIGRGADKPPGGLICGAVW